MENLQHPNYKNEKIETKYLSNTHKMYNEQPFRI